MTRKVYRKKIIQRKRVLFTAVIGLILCSMTATYVLAKNETATPSGSLLEGVRMMSTVEDAANTTYLTETTTKTIDFEQKAMETEQYPVGTNVVVQQGAVGELSVTEQIAWENRQEVARTTLSTAVTRQPVPEITVVGTGEFDPSTDMALPLKDCYLSSPFGERWGRQHQGVDLCVQGGTTGKEVVATFGGTVTEAKHSDGYGNWVELDHGNGYTSRYAHLDELAVEVGDLVTQETLLGYAGATGKVTGAHLHFEVRENGTAIDPLPYLAITETN